MGGGHALRCGGVEYLARAGVEFWRIQALLRLSSGAIVHYLDYAHISYLNTISSEAAAGRSLTVFRDELAVLKALADKGQAEYTDLANAIENTKKTSAQIDVPVADAILLQPTTTGPPSSPPLKFIIATHATGKTRIRDKRFPTLTLCGWAWAMRKAAFPSASPSGAEPCDRCWSKRKSSSSSLEASRSGSSRSSSSSTGES